MKSPLSIRTDQSLRRAIALRRNVGTTERWLSLAGGGAALAAGLRRGGAGGGVLAALGSYLLFRGASGHCPLYAQLHLDTTRTRESGLWGANLVHAQARVTVARPRDEVYRFWRDLENLPRIMKHVREVRTEGNRSHWTARSPFGLRLRWTAQIIHDTPNERLAWRSIPGAEVDSRGEVRFRPTVDGGTELDIDMYYRPPGGSPTRLLARLLGGISERAVRRDIERAGQVLDKAAPQPRTPDRIDGDQGLGPEPVTPAHG